MGGGGQDPRIAVVGMAFRLPGADTPEDLWRIIRNGEDRFTRFTKDELKAAGVPEELYRREDFIGASAVLDDIAGFDARHFGMSAREARLTDPQHRLFLECAQHALENAGYPGERDGKRIGVYASTGYHLYSMQSYLLNNVLPNEDIADWLAGMQVLVGNYTDFNATRVAHRLGLTGPAVNVQTACSSSLVGVHLAAQSLLLDECDIALAGAGAVHVPQVLGYHYVKGSILSRSGRLRAFDAAANGTVGGTGVVAVALKRLSRALADGDTVHGVIRGWGICNDGADKQAFAAPSARGQQSAVRRALDHAGVGADTIGYLETHGTGTLKGDPIELEGAGAAYRQDTDRTGYCALGAVKANIGHLDVASGLAGLVKALLVLKHGVIPPIAGFADPNPLLGLEDSPFYAPRAAHPWPESGTPRRAGVTSLGVGGTNVHLILEEAPEPEPRSATAAPPDVLLVSATSREALADNVRSLRDVLRRRTALPLADLVTTAALGRSHGRHRIAVRAGTPSTLADALDAWLRAPAPLATTAGPVPPGDAPTRVVFQFTGQGSLRPGAAAALYGRFPVVREVLDACEAWHRRLTGEPMLAGLLTEGAGSPGAVWPTATAQPALFALQCALVRLWDEAGIRPWAVTGHSVGEYAALFAAGALSLADGLELSAHRGRLMRDRCAPGAMVAVALERESAAELAASHPGLELAVSNGERSHVLAGPVAGVDRMCAALDDRGTPYERLAVDRAFHTAATEPMLDAFATVLAKIPFAPVRTRFISSLDGRTREPGWVPDPEHLVRHAREPVRYDASLRAVAGERPGVLLEIGPHTTLSSLARRSLPAVRAVPSLHRNTGLTALFGAAADLHCAGADVRWKTFLAGTGGRRVPLPGYRFQHRQHWVGAPPRPLGPISPAREERTMTTEATETGPLLDSILGFLSGAFGEDLTSVPADTPFFDLGADSLLMINVLREIEQEHHVKITMRELFDETGTPRLLAELVAARLPRQPRRPQQPQQPGTVPRPAAAPAPPPAPAPAPTRPASDSAPPVPHAVPHAAVADTAVADTGFVTRQELRELAQRVQQLSQIQLQMLTQLSRISDLLAPRSDATAALTDDEVVR
ncbi:acyltransferase domain-containing protein [Streptomyces sp. NBC_00264]|uniref:type I polyketide synthase n=1 Tax=unclassified Streptomyces TaxID=2593676 RepID=UPI002252FB65|nr:MULTISPECIES: beta-ketoacyl synthase N-terminal-like domain-containing protein [unclassified Streptomyces]MCX5162453.1 acyltransferase domain-containing protein [Streptomyces sp. NBC_00305]MCX5220970.1 acyltransferase domain-containing protein [Streptomyces sp. NBC_00264]